jgi:penicillin-binding protein 2
MEPSTGRILALVNPEAAHRAWPPGSVIKPLEAVAALESGAASTCTEVECRNVYDTGGTRLLCSRPGGHGRVRVEDALAFSCNVYFYKLGERMGPGRLIAAWKEFGLGDGRDPSKGSVLCTVSGRGALARAAVGEAPGLAVTPVQMACAVSAIANGGVVYACTGKGNLRVLRRIKARTHVYDTVRRGMRRAVLSGTAKRAGVPGLSVCGKTGSPQTEKDPRFRHAWFAGFAPLDSPKVVVVVFLPWGHGGSDAAPVAAKIFKAWKETAPP